MKTHPLSAHGESYTLERGQRLMLRSAGSYLFASALAAALGIAGLGQLTLGAVVFLLLMSALLLAAALLCSLLGTLDPDKAQPDRE